MNNTEDKQLLITFVGTMDISPAMVNESMTTNNGKLIVTGPLQRAEVKNQNGRVYPKEILVNESKKYYDTLVTERRAWGELDHPDSAVVNLKNVSHRIIDMYWKGNDLIGKIEIVNTPSGNILKELFKSGGKVGVSSRGLGTVKEVNESLVVQDDFELIAWDFVSNPSTHGAFVVPTNESIIKESAEFNNKVNLIAEKYSKANRLIQELICELSCECNLE
jgi:hypothetical protein